GTDPRSGQLYAYYETMAGGYGGRSSKDGPDAVQCHGQNTENAPIEEVEINYPLRIDRYELIENSEGAGAYRGGLGLRRDYRFPNHEVSFTVLSDRDRWGPPGLAGGQAGQVAEYILDPEGASEKLGSKVTIALEADTVFSYRTCGGGGYGSPLQRDPAAVAADVREGKVSAERAREIYGVVIEDGMVNAAATAALRKERGDGV
ncbi:hydantoinase B/oxoprolinase family protein, partial [bacterium]|nr:hydantoinase B/oxoprolinase family protein [bacterium]